MQKHQNGKKTNGTNVKRQNTKVTKSKHEKIKMRQNRPPCRSQSD